MRKPNKFIGLQKWYVSFMGHRMIVLESDAETAAARLLDRLATCGHTITQGQVHASEHGFCGGLVYKFDSVGLANSIGIFTEDEE